MFTLIQIHFSIFRYYDFERICYPDSLILIVIPSVVGGVLVLAGITTGVIVYYRRSQRNRTRTPGHSSTTPDLPGQIINQMFVLPPVALKSGSEDEMQQSTWDSNDDMYLSTTQDPQD